MPRQRRLGTIWLLVVLELAARHSCQDLAHHEPFFSKQSHATLLDPLVSFGAGRQRRELSVYMAVLSSRKSIPRQGFRSGREVGLNGSGCDLLAGIYAVFEAFWCFAACQRCKDVNRAPAQRVACDHHLFPKPVRVLLSKPSTTRGRTACPWLRSHCQIREGNLHG